MRVPSKLNRFITTRLTPKKGSNFGLPADNLHQQWRRPVSSGGKVRTTFFIIFKKYFSSIIWTRIKLHRCTLKVNSRRFEHVHDLKTEIPFPLQQHTCSFLDSCDHEMLESHLVLHPSFSPSLTLQATLCPQMKKKMLFKRRYSCGTSASLTGLDQFLYSKGLNKLQIRAILQPRIIAD